MNERIQLLADQCYYRNNCNLELFNKEKFAELIIQECCSAIRLNDVFFGGKFQGAILKHFGVEE